MAEKGYFAILGVDFRADDSSIAKRYKKLAIKYHPDKNPSQEAVEEFQKITTSYHVIMDAQNRTNYMRLFMLRCYMSQENPMDGPLRPHYAFMVLKSKSSMGSKTDRMLTFDLLQRKLSSYKKDTLKKEFALSSIAGVQANDKSPLELTITFKETHPYYIRARCAVQFQTLMAVLKRIVSSPELKDDELRILLDDSDSPPTSVHKSRVIKRAERSMGQALVANWEPRFMVMGTTHLIIFRDVDLQFMVNSLPISMLKCTPDPNDRSVFQLATAYWKASFRVLTEEIATKWFTTLREVQASLPSDGGPSRPSARSPDYRPSVVFTEADIANLHTPASAPPKVAPSAFGRPSIELPALQYAVEPSAAAALPELPELAPWDSEHHDGWLQYHDEQGRPYYFHVPTRQTSWVLPEAGGGDVLAADLPTGAEDDASKQAQMAALKDGGDVSSEVAFSEHKGTLISQMQALERGLLKTRRAVEANRPLNDLAAMFEQLRTTFGKMSAVGAEYEKAAMQRDDVQRSFMTDKAAYLNGLQKHVLGEDSTDASVASKIFRKGAYVADTFNKMTNMRGVL